MLTDVHDDDPSSVELLNDLWRWHTDSTDEQSCFLVDNHVNEIVELSWNDMALDQAMR